MKSSNCTRSGSDPAGSDHLCLDADVSATARAARSWPPEASSGVQLLGPANPAVPPVHGDDLAQALMKAGWIPAQWDEQMCLLERDGAQVSLPRTQLDPAAVAVVAHRCGLRPLQLLNCLEEVFTEAVLGLAARVR